VSLESGCLFVCLYVVGSKTPVFLLGCWNFGEGKAQIPMHNSFVGICKEVSGKKH
jgi:hypothetical protein